MTQRLLAELRAVETQKHTLTKEEIFHNVYKIIMSRYDPELLAVREMLVRDDAAAWREHCRLCKDLKASKDPHDQEIIRYSLFSLSDVMSKIRELTIECDRQISGMKPKNLDVFPKE